MAEAVIATTSLTVYYGARRGIEDVSLTVRRGEVFGFLEGMKARDLAVLTATAAAFLTLALLCFARRDVMTGAWPWRRNHPPRRRPD